MGDSYALLKLIVHTQTREILGVNVDLAHQLRVWVLERSSMCSNVTGATHQLFASRVVPGVSLTMGKQQPAGSKTPKVAGRSTPFEFSAFQVCGSRHAQAQDRIGGPGGYVVLFQEFIDNNP
ncbi:hypothetical protein BH23ACT6_BH23ACT6_09340 [soil metagenome]